jgi:hypothetical protein
MKVGIDLQLEKGLVEYEVRFGKVSLNLNASGLFNRRENVLILSNFGVREKDPLSVYHDTERGSEPHSTRRDCCLVDTALLEVVYGSKMKINQKRSLNTYD